MTTAPRTDGVAERIRNATAGWPVDLIVASAVAVAAVALSANSVGGFGWPRAVAGLVLVLVLPGYALVSALFPGRATESVRAAARPRAYSPGTAERLVLSFTFSLALLPPLAVVHGGLGIAFETAPIIRSVAAVIVACSAVGVVRRLALDSDQRYAPPSVVDRAEALWRWASAGGTLDTALSLALCVAVALGVGALAVGLAGPTQGEAYTSVSLMTTSGSGEPVASNYSTNVSAGERVDLTLQVENRYPTAGNYTAVVELQRVRGEGAALDVVDRERLGALSARVPANETWTRTHAVAPTMTGTDLRLVYHVYRGPVPASPTGSDAERTVHLWLTVR